MNCPPNTTVAASTGILTGSCNGNIVQPVCAPSSSIINGFCVPCATTNACPTGTIFSSLDNKCRYPNVTAACPPGKIKFYDTVKAKYICK
jgi:hypothetical protein